MISLILTLAVLGFIVYAIETWVPMAQPFKMAIYVVVAICVILYLMRAFNIADIPLPSAR